MLCGGESGIPFLRKSHGGCNMPPACCQEPPFESHSTNFHAKKENAPTRGAFLFGGESGIRTHGYSHIAGFQDRSLQPLDHLSILPCHREGRKACGDPHPRRKGRFPRRCAPENDKDFGGVYCNTNPAVGQSVFNREFCRKGHSRRCARRSPQDTGRCRRRHRGFRGHISCRWPADPAPFPPAG